MFQTSGTRGSTFVANAELPSPFDPSAVSSEIGSVICGGWVGKKWKKTGFRPVRSRYLLVGARSAFFLMQKVL